MMAAVRAARLTLLRRTVQYSTLDGRGHWQMEDVAVGAIADRRVGRDESAVLVDILIVVQRRRLLQMLLAKTRKITKRIGSRPAGGLRRQRLGLVRLHLKQIRFFERIARRRWRRGGQLWMRDQRRLSPSNYRTIVIVVAISWLPESDRRFGHPWAAI